MKIVYITCCENGLYGLNYLLARNIRPTQVITLSQSLSTKYNISGFLSPKDLCKYHDIKCTELTSYRIEVGDFIDKPDLIIVNGWNRLISKEVINYATYGGIGVHAGHPPIGHGRAPLPWNIIKGMTDIEVYIFKLTENADDGHIYLKQTIEIALTDNVQLLYEKVMHCTAELFYKTINNLKNKTAKYIPQDLKFSKIYPKRSPEDGLIDFTMTAEQIYNFVRAQTKPYPGAFAFLNSQKWIFWRVAFYDKFAYRNEARVPGKILAALPSGLVIMTGTSPIWLLEAETVINGKEIQYPQSLEYVGKVFTN